MAAQPFWVDEGGEEALWNFVWLGPDLLPGLADVEVEKSRSVDVKKVKGSDGATLSDQGYEPAKVTITLRIWTRDQWKQWQNVLPNIDPQRAGGIRTPVTILNPIATHYGIDSIYVTSVSSATPKAGGTMSITIACLQWFPAPKPAKTKKTVQTNQALAVGSDEARGINIIPPDMSRLLP